MNKSGYFTFEVLLPQVTQTDGGQKAGRRRKLMKPLFVTPTGIIEGFPTEVEQFFKNMPENPIVPENHPKIPPGSGYVLVTWVDLERSARFLAWSAGKTEDTRSSVEESYGLFIAEGREGLKKRFSKNHVFYLLREFKKRGWGVD